MTITRVGTNQKYATGWDSAFGKAKPAAGKTAKKVVGGAGLGALIGGIAGGGKGAGIGALVGAGAGTAVAATKKGEQVSVPSESLLEFRLEQPTELPRAK